MLGVESIDESTSGHDVSARIDGKRFAVIIPGALPFIFTGLRSRWRVVVSLVAAEMVSGQCSLDS
jgi:ABC-type nitrate/sulfonate/bicarbonate transport system permease component